MWISYKSVLLGAMSAGSITVAYNYMQNVLTPIGSLSRYVRNLHEIDIALLRIFGLRSEQCTREDSEKLKSTPDIVFSDVCVCCNDDHFLKNVTFSVKPGSLAVLSGPSGIGKSTLLHAVIGYQPLQNGSIKIGGMESWERAIASVKSSLSLKARARVLAIWATSKVWVSLVL